VSKLFFNGFENNSFPCYNFSIPVKLLSFLAENEMTRFPQPDMLSMREFYISLTLASKIIQIDEVGDLLKMPYAIFRQLNLFSFCP
jgi:hypothetical protein